MRVQIKIREQLWGIVMALVITVFCFNILILTIGCGNKQPPVIEYVRQLKPGMSLAEVQNLFPKNWLWIDKPIDEIRYNCWMDRRFSMAPVQRKVGYMDHRLGGAVVSLYFDGSNIIVGFDYSASSGPQLSENEYQQFKVKRKKTKE